MKFFDTNVLVYVADIRDPQKQRIAEDLVTKALGADGFVQEEGHRACHTTSPSRYFAILKAGWIATPCLSGLKLRQWHEN